MANKFYRSISLLLPCLFLIVHFLLEYSENLEFLSQFPTVIFTFHYLKPVLALLTLFFGIYFLKAKIKPTKNEVSPISLIFFGGLFILLSFGPPIFGYYLSHDLDTEIYTPERIQKIKKLALSPEVKAENRARWASIVYVQRGETINFLNVNDKVKSYRPSTSDLEKRQEHLQLKAEIQRNQSFIKNNFKYHMVILVTLLFLFFVVIKIKPPKPDGIAF